MKLLLKVSQNRQVCIIDSIYYDGSLKLPKIIVGKNNEYPILNFRCLTYKAWQGNFGLAWEGLTGVKGKFGFFEEQIKQYDHLIRKLYQ